MSVITIAGMIGVGKTSVAELIGRELGSEVFYESVDDNPILPLFYSCSEEEIQAKRYPFLLQLHFLNKRFEAIKQALTSNKNVLDRSIYEDWYFASINKSLGRITDLEFSIYEGLADNMMQELEELPKKHPDLMIYLKASFETIMHRISLRGRDFEQDEALVAYYRKLWEGYDAWIRDYYDKSEVIEINMDHVDVVGSKEDARKVAEMVKDKLKALGVK